MRCKQIQEIMANNGKVVRTVCRHQALHGSILCARCLKALQEEVDEKVSQGAILCKERAS